MPSRILWWVNTFAEKLKTLAVPTISKNWHSLCDKNIFACHIFLPVPVVVSGFIFLNKKRQEKDNLSMFLRIFWQVNTFAKKLKTLKNSCSSINLKNCLGLCDKTFFSSLFFLSCTSLDSDSWPYTGETRKKMNS
jgi:hypothetical protein